MQLLGENTLLSLPPKGARALIVMRYADVNQDVSSKASKSEAMEDWVVVNIDMFVAWMNIRLPKAMVTRAPRIGVRD